MAGKDIQVNYVSPNRKYSKILHSDEGNSERNEKWRMLLGLWPNAGSFVHNFIIDFLTYL